MIFKLVGRESVDYTSKKTNEQVEGLKLHVLAAKGSNKRVEGCAVETIWISKRSDLYKMAAELPIDTNIDCSYNRWGSVDNFQVLK